MNSTDEFLETKIAYYIGVYGMFVIGVVGGITEVMAFFAFGKYKPQTSSTFYLQALAFADFISLMWDSVIATALPLIGVPTEGSSMWVCKIGIWHNMASSIVSSCALLVVAMDRAILLSCSTFYKVHCTRKSAWIVSVGLWIFTYAYTTPLLYFYEVVQPGTCSLGSDVVKQTAGLKYVTFLSYGPYFSVPVVGIIVCNVVIVKILYQRKKNRQTMGKTTAESDELSSLLIADCVAFLILIAIVAALWALTWQSPADDYEKAKFQLMFVLAEFVSCVEESIDFFVYWICNKKFRRTTLQMFALQSSTVEPITP